MNISVFITLNQLLEVFFLKLNFQKKKKKKIVTKRRLLLQVHFVHLILFVLPMGSQQGRFVRRYCIFNQQVQLKQGRCFRFVKKDFVFQKTCFKGEVMRRFKISSDCHIKSMRISQTEGYFKNLQHGFSEEQMFFC